MYLFVFIKTHLDFSITTRYIEVITEDTFNGLAQLEYL